MIERTDHQQLKFQEGGYLTAFQIPFPLIKGIEKVVLRIEWLFKPFEGS
jgi:hypothetical protein